MKTHKSGINNIVYSKLYQLIRLSLKLLYIKKKKKKKKKKKNAKQTNQHKKKKKKKT